MPELVRWDQAHALFTEPGLRLWLRHLHSGFGLLSASILLRASDLIYALGQTAVPLLLTVWLYRNHRRHFPLVRNITLLSTFFAVIGYELFPTAPPRLTSGLGYQSHVFHFQNTVRNVMGYGKFNDIPPGYSAYSAVPSLHIAWALIVAGAAVLLAPWLIARLVASLYPLIMLFAVIATANHYLLDAVASVLEVALATVIALTLEPGHTHLRHLSEAWLPF
ncbi:MAG: phosphatase PAP2 family protein [Chloroflexota bacterium]